jgi:hypothetical protein
VAVVRPNWFVVYRVYVVVADGMTTMLVPRTGPACGSMMLYVVFETLQLKVTGCPAITVVGFAEKLLMVGEAPVGTFAGVKIVPV